MFFTFKIFCGRPTLLDPPPCGRVMDAMTPYVSRIATQLTLSLSYLAGSSQCTRAGGLLIVDYSASRTIVCFVSFLMFLCCLSLTTKIITVILQL